MLPTVYLETTIFSYLAARPSRDRLVASHQRITSDWWRTRRSSFSLVLSQAVVEENAAGHPEMAERRLAYSTGIPRFLITETTYALARRLL